MRRWLNAAATTRDRIAGSAGKRGSGRAVRCTTALDTVGGELRLCNHPGCAPSDRSNVTLVGTLRNRGGTSAVSSSSAPLSGISDADAPRLVSFVVSDPDVMPLARPIPGTSGAKGSGKNDGAHQVKDAIAEALKKKAEA